MVFTVIRPDGSKEKRQHIPYKVVDAGDQWKPEWRAIDSRNGRMIARSYISEEHLRSHADSMTEKVN